MFNDCRSLITATFISLDIYSLPWVCLTNGVYKNAKDRTRVKGLVCLSCRYSGVFPSLNMAVKRQEQALQDYKRLQAKVENYEEKEKTGPVMVKLDLLLRPVREDFESKNKQLLDEMPKFYHIRIDYFQPSFEALICALVVYFTEMYKIFSELTAQIDQAGLTDEQKERETEAKLSELRALSIVADD
uniref:Bridging integrator 3 n=1 Tax=Cynoglossus semilaevis TaxID=244447 RepID=A0A3P8W398_CYNSE